MSASNNFFSHSASKEESKGSQSSKSQSMSASAPNIMSETGEDPFVRKILCQISPENHPEKAKFELSNFKEYYEQHVVQGFDPAQMVRPNPLLHEIKCPICILVPNNALECYKCRHFGCKACITRCKMKCPFKCERPAYPIEPFGKLHFVIQNLIDDAEIFCPNIEKFKPIQVFCRQGILKTSQVQKHLESECDFRLVKCKNEKFGCKEVMFAIMQDSHIQLGKCKFAQLNKTLLTLNELLAFEGVQSSMFKGSQASASNSLGLKSDFFKTIFDQNLSSGNQFQNFLQQQPVVQWQQPQNQNFSLNYQGNGLLNHMPQW